MSAATHPAGLQVDCIEHDEGVVFEFTSFSFPPSAALQGVWPVAPGAVLRDGEGRAAALHFAPGRWLVPAPTDLWHRAMADAEAATAGAAVEVTGKWCHLTLGGRDAGRLVACSVDPDAVLDGREVAAVVLFDCPCVLAKSSAGYEIWVRSSFARDFVASIGRLRS
jgi:heterotetrameric sarcosine oxidase gamma subunit